MDLDNLKLPISTLSEVKPPAVVSTSFSLGSRLFESNQFSDSVSHLIPKSEHVKTRAFDLLDDNFAVPADQN